MITKNYSWSLGSCPNKSLDPVEPPVRPRQADHLLWQLWSAAGCARSAQAFTRTVFTPLWITRSLAANASKIQGHRDRYCPLLGPRFQTPQRIFSLRAILSLVSRTISTKHHKISTNQHFNFNVIFICKPLTLNEKSI
jgi:hypothetical protein